LEAGNPVQAARAYCDLAERLLEHGLFQDLLTALDGNALLNTEELLAEWRRTFRCDDPNYSALLLASLLALVATARRARREDETVSGPKDLGPFLQLKQHLWLRELRRMVADVGREPVLRFADDLQDPTDPLHLPVVHCRECHAAGWGGVKKKEETAIQAEVQGFYQAYFGNHPDLCLLFPLAEGTEPPSRHGLVAEFCPQCAQVHPERAGSECQGCGVSGVLRVWMPDMTREVKRGGDNRVVSHNDCPFCGARQGLSVMGYRATTLGSVMIGRLFGSPYNEDPAYREAPDAGKKLIAFSDSVQDAAHRAGFYGANTYRTTVRHAMARFITSQGEGMPLDQIAHGLGPYWRERMGGSGEYVGTFLAPNMAWLRDYRALREMGRLPEGSDLPELVDKRLTWETLSEFGLRSRIGRTLERTTTATVAMDSAMLDRIAEGLAHRLPEEIEALRGLEAEAFRAFLLGMLWRLRSQGAFYHSFLDAYIKEGGNEFLLNTKMPFMPGFGRASRPPSFLSMESGGRSFEGLVRNGSWYQNWFYKTLAAGECFMATAEYRQAYELTLAHLEREGVLRQFSSKGKPVWGLDPGRWICTTAVTELVCDTCGHRVQAPADQADVWTALPCLRPACPGTYSADPLPKPHSRYGQDRPRRLVPAEHSALLDTDQRQWVENSFINGDRPWDVNLLSATPTLEMGIDIGSLSTVLLASVPPGQANYRQRTGRAGRRDGNALNLTIANGQSHDLYFFAQPEEMVAGPIRPPGVFLEATAVLERQLLAFCFDRWAATGIDHSAIPTTLKQVLDAVEAEDRARFPFTLIEFVGSSQGRIFQDFIRLFPGLGADAYSYLEARLFGGEGEEGWAYKMNNRLRELARQRKEWRRRVDQLQREIKRLEGQPQDDESREILNGLKDERAALQGAMKGLNIKPTLNFFTDEGLLPNYAFPEEGITLQSVIFQRKERKEDEDGPREHITYEFTRPAQAALSELAPENRFYAVGHQLQIDQVDLKKSNTETWRLCDNCHYSEKLDTSGDPHSVCPRCGSPQWADGEQKRALLRLRQVYAYAGDRESRIGDESEQREPVFYNQQMLVDVPPGSAERAYRLQEETLPFGFEYIPKARFREVNFGEREIEGSTFRVAGDLLGRRGFKICRHCGKVALQRQRRRQNRFDHAYSCPLSRSGATVSDDDFIDSLYLYRELESEAVRILLPLGEVAFSEVRLYSLIAALRMGLERHFRGGVEHLQFTTYSDPDHDSPSRRQYLVVYDTIPGGSGYLKELLQDPETLLGVLRTARDDLHACPCAEEENKDGCYRCLLAYRDSRHMEKISRKEAERLLNRILDTADSLVEVDGLERIDINALLESELEHRFIETLANAGPDLQKTPQLVNDKPGWFLTLGAGEENRAQAWLVEPQVKLGAAQGVNLQSQADFVLWPARMGMNVRPVAVFMDGFQFHHDQVGRDTAKRQAILDSGRFRLWNLGWHDLPQPGRIPTTKQNQFLFQGLVEGARGRFDQIAENEEGWLNFASNEDLIREGPFAWLMLYLRHGEVGRKRLQGAAFSRAVAWLQPETLGDENLREAVREELNESGPPRAREELLPEDGTTVLGGVAPSLGTAHNQRERVLMAVPQDSLRSLQALKADTTALLVLDDRESEPNKEYEQAWNAFWTAADLLQFLGKFFLATRLGVEGGMYAQEILGVTDPGIVALGAAVREEEAGPAWTEVGELSLFNGEELDRLRGAGVPVPEVGWELTEEGKGTVAELELAWPNRSVGVLAGDDGKQEPILQKQGWKVTRGLSEEEIVQLRDWIFAAEEGGQE